MESQKHGILVDNGQTHLCGTDCECFIDCKECGEPFCEIESTDSTPIVTCLAHSGGDWDIRDHKHYKHALG